MFNLISEKSVDEGLPLSDKLEVKKQEEPYRRYVLEADIRQTKIVVFIVLAATLFFISSDYRFFGASSELLWLLIARFILIGYSITLLLRLNGTSTSQQIDVYLLSYMVILVLISVYISSTRPAGYISYILVSLLEICAFYLAFPLPVHLQIIPALLGTVANTLLLLIRRPQPDSLSKSAIIFCFLCANLIGIIASRRANYWKRQQFAMLIREKALRQELEQAIDEIKTLRGIIPICAYCKNVRPDPDSWQQIEEYVTMHTHAQFTHGICPDCAKKYFGELKTRK